MPFGRNEKIMVIVALAAIAAVSLHHQYNNDPNSNTNVIPLALSRDSKRWHKSYSKNIKLPILVMACNRVSVSRCLDGLLKYRPDPDMFPIIVSQDCAHKQTAKVILSYGSQVTYIQHPDQSDPEVAPKDKGKKHLKGYYKISRHYSWALRQIFGVMKHSAVIVVEDDLEVAPDFFEYFYATYPLLINDESLWCISAWNDNGKPDLIDRNRVEMLHRTDFFPGLGWMMTKDVWLELESKWPKSYWDEWMRHPEQRRNRACIRPEVPRTQTFGRIGVSNGQFFDKHLQFIKVNDNFTEFSSMNLSYLTRSIYDKWFIDHVHSLPVVKVDEIKMLPHRFPVRITYHDQDSFKKIAEVLGNMDDFECGVPRTGYYGIVNIFYNGRRVYLAPRTECSLDDAQNRFDYR